MKSTWLAITSLIIAACALLLTLFQVIPSTDITEQSYVGIIATLIGVCVTFAVAYQIYNAVETRERLKQLKELTEELNATKGSMAILENDLKMRHADLSCDTFFQKGKYLYAFSSGILCFFHAVKVNDVGEIESMLSGLPVTIDNIDGIDADYLLEIDSIISSIQESLKDNDVYQSHRRKFEAIISQYRKKIDELTKS